MSFLITADYALSHTASHEDAIFLSNRIYWTVFSLRINDCDYLESFLMTTICGPFAYFNNLAVFHSYIFFSLLFTIVFFCHYSLYVFKHLLLSAVVV